MLIYMTNITRLFDNVHKPSEHYPKTKHVKFLFKCKGMCSSDVNCYNAVILNKNLYNNSG